MSAVMNQTSTQPASPALLSVDGLSKSFGGIHAVRDISFRLHDQEILGLIGPNGAGKTTCFNLITGFYTPSSGKVAFKGRDITGAKPYSVAQAGIVRSFQKTNILRRLSVFENVLAGHYLASRQSLFDTFFPRAHVARAEKEARDSAAEIIEMIGLQSRLNAPATLLSCGELRLLEVAVALAAKPTILMLDEPAAGLNSSEAMAFGETLKKVRRTKVQAILLVEHNMSLVMGVSDRLVVMNFGEKLAEGKPAEIQGNAKVVEAYLGKARN
ncbi:MAG: transporter ATP-binding protein [Paucimonas sp.]|nr:transporter ATP-binding protein [Paucimonas sp.]